MEPFTIAALVALVIAAKKKQETMNPFSIRIQETKDPFPIRIPNGPPIVIHGFTGDMFFDAQGNSITAAEYDNLMRQWNVLNLPLWTAL